jgi:hypothetical protein
MFRTWYPPAAVLCVVLLPLAALGCGSSSAPKGVQLSLIAPTNGAKLVVSRVFVTGSVRPASARVAVAGHTVPNHRGRFGVWLSLRRGVTHLRVDASAPGLVPYRSDLAVESRPSVHRHHHVAVALQAPPGGAGLASGQRWTAATEKAFVLGCVARGAPQRYCECALPYIKRAGSPLEISASQDALAARRRAVVLLLKTIQRCV